MNLPPYPEAFRDDAHKVRGCASQVWLHATQETDGRFIFLGDSDAHIVKGLVALLIALYSGKSAQEIVDINPKEALAGFDLDGHITPQRANGLTSMISRIQALAKDALAS